MKKSLENALEKIRKVFKKRPEILAAYLYGSHAKGYARKGSDIDVAVMLDPKFRTESLYKYMFGLEDKVNEAVSDFKIEVIPTTAMSYPLKYTATLFGKTIYSRDDRARTREEVALQNTYEDLEGFYELQYQKILERAQKRLNA